MNQVNDNSIASTSTEALNSVVASGLIGYIVYHTLSSNLVDEDTINDALVDAGFNEIVSGVPFDTTFRTRCRAITHRYTLAESSSTARKIFALELPEDDETVAFAVHIGKATGKRSHSLAQLATIVLHKDEEQVTWTICDTGRIPGESIEDYTDRVISFGVVEPVTEQDIREVATVLSATELRVEREGGKVTNSRIHGLIRRFVYCNELHILSLRPTGGIYFVPNLPGRGIENPTDVMRRLGEVVENVGNNTLFLVPQYGEPGTYEAVNAAAKETLGSKIADLEKELDSIEDIKHPTALAARLNSVKDVLATADVYAGLVQFKADALRERIAKVSDHLRDVIAQRVTEKAARKTVKRETAAQMEARLRDEIRAELMAELSESAEIEVIERNEPVIVTETQVTIFTGFAGLAEGQIRSCCKDALATKIGINGQLTVEKTDEGYYWTLNDREGNIDSGGAYKTQGMAVAAIKEAIVKSLSNA